MSAYFFIHSPTVSIIILYVFANVMHCNDVFVVIYISLLVILSFHIFIVLPNQVHFAPCTASQNAETRFAAKREFIRQAAKQRDEKTNLKSTTVKARGLAYSWNK